MTQKSIHTFGDLVNRIGDSCRSDAEVARVRITIHPGLPARVEVVHEGLTDAEVEAALMEMAAEIPSPCMLIVLPRVCWDVA